VPLLPRDHRLYCPIASNRTRTAKRNHPHPVFTACGKRASLSIFGWTRINANATSSPSRFLPGAKSAILSDFRLAVRPQIPSNSVWKQHTSGHLIWLTPKILVVEDDDSTREALSQILEMEGYETLHALETLHHSPDLILLDLRMPGMDGREFLALKTHLCRQNARNCCHRFRGFGFASAAPSKASRSGNSADRNRDSRRERIEE
jgi:hypothetical protein